MKGAHIAMSSLALQSAMCGATQITSDHDKALVPSDDRDLLYHSTMPDVRPPVLEVTIHDPARVSPGYFFVNPYVEHALAKTNPGPEWSPYQIGPHIYDAEGSLVWSGARMFPRSNTYDLRTAVLPDRSLGLAFILGRESGDDEYRHGTNLLLDAGYGRVGALTPIDCGTNMHDFHTSPDGGSAIYIISKSLDMSKSNDTATTYRGRLSRGGFREVNSTDGRTIFNWWATDHIQLAEVATRAPGKGEVGYWDTDHINSVEKTAEGDYIVSARHTDTIYKVSGSDGHVLWRLGGRFSDFEQDFNFSRQHDARVIEALSSPGTTVLSLLDNGADSFNNTAETSSALVVSLDHATQMATLLRRYLRPDGGLTRLRGNVQLLPNGNVLVAWSENGFLTEFAEDGAIVAEASFASRRFVAYRAYKQPWAAAPDAREIRMHAGVVGARADALTTLARVSWNGATEVRAWRLWGCNARLSAEEGARACERRDPATHRADLSRYRPIGDTPRAGFETELHGAGAWTHVVAEGLNVGDVSLGLSSVVSVSPHSRLGEDAFYGDGDASASSSSASQGWSVASLAAAAKPSVKLLAAGGGHGRGVTVAATLMSWVVLSIVLAALARCVAAGARRRRIALADG